MRRLALLIAALAVAGSAQAQTWTSRAGQVTPDVHRHQLDAHRAEMDRLRFAADLRQLEARQAAVESRLSVMRVEAARQPPLVTTPPPPRSSALATARRETASGAVGQIDAWLDRPAH